MSRKINGYAFAEHLQHKTDGVFNYYYSRLTYYSNGRKVRYPHDFYFLREIKSRADLHPIWVDSAETPVTREDIR